MLGVFCAGCTFGEQLEGEAGQRVSGVGEKARVASDGWIVKLSFALRV